MTTPQLILSLSPEDTLVVELPGVLGTRRKIELSMGASYDPVAQLVRILRAQRNGQSEIGLDGEPTSRQVRHWERHASTPDSRCPFCRAEGAFSDEAVARREPRRVLVARSPDGVEVRRIKPGASGLPAGTKARVDAKEMGL